MAQLTPARFVALYELTTNPGPIGHLDKRTARALLNAELIEWCDTTSYAHIYRATPAGVDAARDHLAYLAKREEAGRLYRSDAEQEYQDRAGYRLDQLEKAVAEERPETPADRVAALVPAPAPQRTPEKDRRDDRLLWLADRTGTAVLRSPDARSFEPLAAAGLVTIETTPHELRKVALTPEGREQVQRTQAEHNPAPLPKRTPGGTRIEDAIARHNTTPADRAGHRVSGGSDGSSYYGTCLDCPHRTARTRTADQMDVLIAKHVADTR